MLQRAPTVGGGGTETRGVVTAAELGISKSRKNSTCLTFRKGQQTWQSRDPELEEGKRCYQSQPESLDRRLV